MDDFSGKTAFITGGASGIGFGIAEAFAEVGMQIMLSDIEATALDAAVATLSESGARVRGVQCDVMNADSVAAAAQTTIDAFGNVHLLCNNAGVSLAGSVDTASLEAWHWVMAVNFMGAVHGVRSFLPQMKAHGEASHILNTGALSSVMPLPGIGPYSAAKAALLSVTETLALELEGTNVGTTILLPAAVRTRLSSSVRNRPDAYGGTVENSPEHLQVMGAFQAMFDQAGFEPIRIGRRAVEAMSNNELFAFTHVAWRPEVEARNQRFAEALNAADKSPALEGTGTGREDLP